MSVPDAALVENPALVSALLSGDPTRIGRALPTSTLLLPASPLGDGRAVAHGGRDGTGRQLLWAFTDSEALAAFDRRPASAALAVAGRELAGAREIIAVNPGGPGATLLRGGAPDDLPGRSGVPGNNGGSAGRFEDPLVHPERRTQLRAEARQAHERGRACVAAGELPEAIAWLEQALAVCARLSDRLHGAATALELAGCHVRAGELDLALALWERGADVLARFGEPDLALAALLDAAEAAAVAGELDEADRFGASALVLCAGEPAADRLAALWRAVSPT